MAGEVAVVGFGSGALLLFAAVYFYFDRRRARAANARVTPFNITFARLFGLLTVAVLGTALAFLATDNQLASSAFTLLGTIAGYLAGAKATATATGAGQPGAPPGAPGVSGIEEHL